MKFRKREKKIGLIALLSCVFTATVAFAAYTGDNYINGTVKIVGNPLNMVLLDTNGAEATAGSVIASGDTATITGKAHADDLTAGEATTVGSFDVKLFCPKQHETVYPSVTYNFTLRNNGGTTAYLQAVNIASTTGRAGGGAIGNLAGLTYSLTLTGANNASFTITSSNGAAASASPSSGGTQAYFAVAPDSTVAAKLTVTARDTFFANLEKKNATLTMGEIDIVWSAVDSSTGS